MGVHRREADEQTRRVYVYEEWKASLFFLNKDFQFLFSTT